jgi:Uma2 family endonuclease
MWTVERFRRQFTRDEYYQMAEVGILRPDERTELIEGEILLMPPEGPSHAGISTLTDEVVRRAFGPGFVVRSQHPLNLGLTIEPEPDIAVVPGPARVYVNAHPTTALLVMEVSDTTLVYDRTDKASLYARAGIRDYWVVNVLEEVVEVFREPQLQANTAFGYGYAQHTRHGRGETLTSLAAPGVTIRVEDLLP